MDFTYYFYNNIYKKYNKFFDIINKEYFMNIFFDGKDHKYNFEYSIFNLFSNMQMDSICFYYEPYDYLPQFKNGVSLNKYNTSFLYPCVNNIINPFKFTEYEMEVCSKILKKKNLNEQNNVNYLVKNDDLTILLYDYYNNEIKTFDKYQNYNNEFRKSLGHYILLYKLVNDMNGENNNIYFRIGG
jgi:hypothetical protein